MLRVFRDKQCESMSFLKKIQNSLPLTFPKYMEMALYDDEFGYYTTHQNILGSKGDFITAPELTPLFGLTLAKQIQAVFLNLSKPCLLELGAGSGRLCVDILVALERLNQLPEYYYILEVSPVLKEQQQRRIQQEIPHLSSRVIWLSEWPNEPFEGMILANEVLDAMPVHRFEWRNQDVFESVIVWNEEKQQLQESFCLSNNPQLIEYVKNLNLGDSVYRSEVNFWIPGWLSGMNTCLSKGVILLIDYGFPRREFYHPDRFEGTLMCHQKQKAHSDFLNQPGLCDITAHVDFTHVAEEAHHLLFSILGYTHQAAFLLANGILDELAKIEQEQAYQKQATCLKLLLQSQEMGEIFKVMALGKNYEWPLKGFSLQDKRVSL